MDDGKLLYVSYILSFDEERKFLIIYIKFKDQSVDDGGTYNILKSANIFRRNTTREEFEEIDDEILQEKKCA